METAKSSPPLSALEREIIDDIQAACRRFGWPSDVRPSFQDYLEQRGHFYEKDIKRLGGWKRLCALGGMHARNRIAPPLAEGDEAQRKAAFDAIVADAREVGQKLRLKTGDRLTHAVYRRGGGLYGWEIVQRVGRWSKLSAAAGFPSSIGGNAKTGRRWQKIKYDMPIPELDAALDGVLADARPPRGIVWKKGLRGPRGKRPAGTAEQPAKKDHGTASSAAGWGLREAARAMGVSVETLMERYRKAPPARPQARPDPERAGVYRLPLSGETAEAHEGGRDALIDAATWPLIEGGAFNLSKTGATSESGKPGSVYVSVRLADGTVAPLRRIVMGVTAADDGVRVSHVNGDPLDCRRDNLVVHTTAECARHAQKGICATRGRSGSSRFKGVCWVKKEQKWRAKIQKDGRPFALGQFTDEIAAARAYDKAARDLFGERAWLNFPDGVDAFLAADSGDDGSTPLTTGERDAA